ncbi:helix-turn-helix domain-containing protein [Ancylobacter sp. Lp-2]|uniref:helix-turn-helix domain-containing protein n=1 Tax=Ancylobacter sp. Lp-2 TaxID=2881339 RepID=UPI001E3B42B5|nr:helix-turn-helix domain-containing protein [Ancylobacter sp. Lp-2]MCB4771050.1 helix-turn-helix domain-containing protein [Ancylobacter sp. Lp-2]
MPTIHTGEHPVAFDVMGAARILSVGRSTVFEEIRAGRLEARKIGRRTLITRAAIEAWLAALPVRSATAA